MFLVERLKETLSEILSVRGKDISTVEIKIAPTRTKSIDFRIFLIFCFGFLLNLNLIFMVKVGLIVGRTE